MRDGRDGLALGEKRVAAGLQGTSHRGACLNDGGCYLWVGLRHSRGIQADVAGQAIGVAMVFPRFVNDIEIVFLQAQSPAS